MLSTLPFSKKGPKSLCFHQHIFFQSISFTILVNEQLLHTLFQKSVFKLNTFYRMYRLNDIKCIALIYLKVVQR